jgi:hypothetical protein
MSDLPTPRPMLVPHVDARVTFQVLKFFLSHFLRPAQETAQSAVNDDTKKHEERAWTAQAGRRIAAAS